MDVGPLELIDIAAATGCEQVSLFTYSTQAVLPGQTSRLVFPLVTREMKRSVFERLAQMGVSVNGVEFFPLTADADVSQYIPALALGRELGAVRAMTHIHDIDRARAVERLGTLSDLARAEGLTLGIEFTPLTLGCVSIHRAAWFVDQVGRSNVGIGVDALHLVRSGGTPADVAALDARYFCNAQMCDGHGLHTSSDYMIEARNRELPGAGDFPLAALLQALPAVTAIEVEVPSQRRLDAGMSAIDHVRDAVSRLRVLVDALPATA
jgi:sugar phosphate isomerase/epimerase